MTGVLKPGVRLLQRFSFAHKFQLVFLLFALPLGYALWVISSALLSEWTPAWPLYLGLLFLFMVMRAPQGLAGLIAQGWALVRGRSPALWLPGADARWWVPLALVTLGIEIRRGQPDREGFGQRGMIRAVILLDPPDDLRIRKAARP